MKPGLSKRRRADVLEDFEEHLIPELCRMICFPALYWLKASTLPSIIHRLTQLLIAEDLRTTIIRETNLGALTLPSNDEWPALDTIEKESEQLVEPILDTTLDDTIESIQAEPDTNELEIDSMLDDAQKKKKKHYKTELGKKCTFWPISSWLRPALFRLPRRPARSL